MPLVRSVLKAFPTATVINTMMIVQAGFCRAMRRKDLLFNDRTNAVGEDTYMTLECVTPIIFELA